MRGQLVQAIHKQNWVVEDDSLRSPGGFLLGRGFKKVWFWSTSIVENFMPGFSSNTGSGLMVEVLEAHWTFDSMAPFSWTPLERQNSKQCSPKHRPYGWAGWCKVYLLNHIGCMSRDLHLNWFARLVQKTSIALLQSAWFREKIRMLGIDYEHQTGRIGSFTEWIT